jgi:peptidoglycan pentaglycine glycine transferase (the second and third glycine)
MKFVELNEKEFDKYARKMTCKSFFQTSMMGSINRENGNDVYYLGVEDNDLIVAAGMFATRNSYFNHKYLYAPRGFLADYGDQKIVKYFVDNLYSFCKKNNYFMLKIDPNLSLIERDTNGLEVHNGYNNVNILNYFKSLGFKYLNHSDQQKWMYVLPLKESSAELFKTFAPNTRNYIHKVEKMGVVVRDLKIDELDKFLAVMNETGERKGFNSRTLKYYKQMYNTFGKDIVFKVAELNLVDYIVLLNKEKEDIKLSISHIENPKSNESKVNDLNKKITSVNKRITEAKAIKKVHGDVITLSASMFMLYGDEIVYLFSGNYDEFMKFNGQYAIQWNMMNYAIEHKYKMYNFYGISGNFDKHDPNYGIYLFKRGFNGYVVETIGELDLGITNFYSVYKLIKKIKS